jgi:hypothetical protein
MNWKRFLIISVNILFISFPYNILGCGGEIDPYDYYTSFFQNDLVPEVTWHPFYYTNNQFLYESEEPVDVAEATSSEWIAYCGGNITKKQAYDFVCGYAQKDLASIYANLDKNQPLKIPDSVKANKITGYFLNSKDKEALGYLMYAKQVQPSVIGNWDDWDPASRDSVKMSRLIKNGQQLYAASTKDFIKLRFAYQILRLAHYSNRDKECNAWYDDMVKNNNTKSILQDLCVSLKAGALFRLGKNYEAAYIFSNQFSKSDVKKIANYMSFSWCVKRLNENDRKQCLALCKNNEEKANMLGLFALGSAVAEGETIKKIAKLSPESSMLEVLTIREINKIEENYLTPQLAKEKGGTRIYYSFADETTQTSSQQWLTEATLLAPFFHSLSLNMHIKNPALFEVSAAYLSYITKDYVNAKKYLGSVRKMKASEAIKDQLVLTSLLVIINEKDKIDPAFEAEILPTLQWIESKASAENKLQQNEFAAKTNWIKFYRNVFTEILAKRYHKQGEIYKEALCIGKAFLGQEYSAVDFVQNKMETKDLMALYQLQQSGNKTNWEKYLCNAFPMKNDEVTDVIAMTHIRDYNFTTALEWLNKIKDPKVLAIDRNPFANLLQDSMDSIYSFDKGNFNKVTFCKEMNALKEKETQGKITPAELLKEANGFYNMTYYGRAWQLVKYDRSGADGYHIPKDATAFQKEYYGCFTAEAYYKKAMDASRDANFKARCLFMMAKCSQKQVPQPQYQDFPGNYAAYEIADKKYFPLFKKNKYFPQLQKDYTATAFYKQAVNTCSYLKDFLQKK